MDARKLKALLKTLRDAGVAEYAETETGVRVRFDGTAEPAMVAEHEPKAESEPKTKTEDTENILYWSAR